MKSWSLSRRILFLALAPVWIISILLILLVIIVGITEIDGALIARGTVITRHLAPACEYGTFSGNREVLQSLADAIMKEDDAQGVVITSANNIVLAESGKPGKIAPANIQAAQLGKPLKGKNGTMIFGAPIYQGTPEGESFDIFDRSTLEMSAKPKLLGYVYFELNTASSERTKSLFAIISVLIGIAGTAGASVLAMRMSRDITTPLTRLIEGVHKMAEGAFNTRIPEKSGGELQQLENGFNVMAEQIENSHNEMKRINTNLENLVAERTQELEQKNIALERLSNTDRLTSLCNRFKLETILDEEHQRCQRYGNTFAIAIIDVDKFKHVNDTYGHQVGDQVLISIANILQEQVRSIDAVGRWGGEEFLVIFPETNLQSAIAIAEKLRRAIAEFDFETVGTRTASFGVAAYRHPDDVTDMMRRADHALYEAKNLGRNRVESKDS
ncbi:MAG: diguanylate cyclase [Burkholderiales bacterium]|nr:diguanylate cyclase [Burkholderiales bacterium]